MAQQIEFQIRAPALEDDYLTWAPAPARIRQVPGPSAADRRVVLTNDPEGPVPAGRKLPLDGNVAFARSVAVGETATESTLELVLPKDGAWVDLIVAGSFPRASTKDKDAVIEVHDGAANGPIIHRHAAMVRIRKDHRELTDKERKRFLRALSRLHREFGGYERFVRIHQLTSGRFEVSPPYFWPDLAHRGSAFLAWHRAYLLTFERELQKIDASVALPYWRMDQLPSVFEEKFMGANTTAEALVVEPSFAGDNPLSHWTVDNQRLYRFPTSRTEPNDVKQFFDDDKLASQTIFSLFARQLEGNPHNVGHNWTGPWMQNCLVSPSDPVFWPFHTGFDRQWARWQWLGDHLRPDGSNDSYSPKDAYDDAAQGCNVPNPNGCQAIGHHLKDTMWPWNSEVGPGASIKANRPPTAQSQPFIGPFPKASIAGLWPKEPATPTPGDMIDYAGVTPQRLDMGFGYDDVPYGAKLPIVATGPGGAVAATVQSTPVQAQPEAVEIAAEIAVARDKSQSEQRRIAALRFLAPSENAAAAKVASDILDEPGRSDALGAAAIEVLSLQMMFGNLDHSTHHFIMEALRKALGSKDVGVRQAALRVLVAHRDAETIAKLVASLETPSPSLSALEAITGLTVAGVAQNHAAASIRKYVTSGDASVRAAAVAALASDPGSRSTITALASDTSQPEQVRTAAIRAIAITGGVAIPVLLDVVKNGQESPALRMQAASALAAAVETAGGTLSKEQLETISAELRKLESNSTLAPAAGRALKATDTARERK